MLELFEPLRQVDSVRAVLFRLALATVFGGLLGLERERKHGPAGFRTYMLVCLGAALAMMINQYDALIVDRTDVSRFGAQVISGIGFLGAGTIIVTGHQEVKGLTTAAGLWASACMGIAIGAGFYECVILAFVLILLSVRLLAVLETHVVENSRNMNIYVEFQSMDDVGAIIGCIKTMDVQIYDVDLMRGSEERLRIPSAVFSLHLNQKLPHTRVLAAISELDAVTMIDEI